MSNNVKYFVLAISINSVAAAFSTIFNSRNFVVEGFFFLSVFIMLVQVWVLPTPASRSTLYDVDLSVRIITGAVISTVSVLLGALSGFMVGLLLGFSTMVLSGILVITVFAFTGVKFELPDNLRTALGGIVFLLYAVALLGGIFLGGMVSMLVTIRYRRSNRFPGPVGVSTRREVTAAGTCALVLAATYSIFAYLPDNRLVGAAFAAAVSTVAHSAVLNGFRRSQPRKAQDG